MGRCMDIPWHLSVYTNPAVPALLYQPDASIVRQSLHSTNRDTVSFTGGTEKLWVTRTVNLHMNEFVNGLVWHMFYWMDWFGSPNHLSGKPFIYCLVEGMKRTYVIPCELQIGTGHHCSRCMGVGSAPHTTTRRYDVHFQCSRWRLLLVHKIE